MKFSKRIGNIRIESGNDKFDNNGEHNTLGMLCVLGSGCQEKCEYIGHWERDEDGYYFRFASKLPHRLLDCGRSYVPYGNSYGIDQECFRIAFLEGQARLNRYFLGEDVIPLTEEEKQKYVAQNICPNCPLYGCPRKIEDIDKCVILRADSHEELNVVTIEKKFPILGTRDSIPWSVIAPHEAQALINHCGQTLERLAERGGLSWGEALAVLTDSDFKMMDEQVAADLVMRIVAYPTA